MISEPAAARVFVGRAAELEAIGSAFARGARSVSLSGPPGAGKTRLAARLVELDAAALHPGLVIDLAHARTAEALVAALAAGFDLRSDAGPPPDRARVAAALGAWCPQLVVLDNAEGLDDPARAQLSALLAALPGGARIIVTSRDKSGLGCDAAFEIAGLGAADRPGARDLFVERARAMGVPLQGEDDDAPIRAIVRALDGNPLAIELAAAQLDVLSPREILERLSRRLDLTADRTTGARFPTLRAAIGASWDGLDAGARRVLATLGIFAGELSADAAEAVVADAAVDVVAALRTLRDRSLLAVRRTTTDGGSGKNRLRLDASVRAFARDQLAASGELEVVAARHAAWFVGRATAMANALRRRGDREARGWLLDEQDELVAIARGSDPASALGAALALAPLWERTGRCAELIEVIDAPVAVGARPEGDDALSLAIARAQAWGLAGRLADARAVLEEALAITLGAEGEGAATSAARDERAADLVAEALTHLMVRRRQLGDAEAAIAAGERAFSLLDEKDAPHLYAANAACLGLTFAEIGRPAEARRYDERARDAFRSLGDRWGEGLVLGNLAQLAQAEGDLDGATRFAEAAIDAFRASRDPLYEGVYRGVGASIEREAGRLDAAQQGYDRAVALLSAGGARHVEGIFRAQRSGLLAIRGAHDAARDELDLAASLLRAAGAPAYLALVDLHAAEVELHRARAPSPIDEARRTAAEVAARDVIATARALPAARQSQFISFAVRVIARALDDRLVSVRTLVVAVDAASFQLPPSSPVSLAKRTAPRLVFAALVAARRAATGPTPGVLGIDALFAAGWPGERAIASAQANRVRVAIATLRSLGLEGVVVTDGAGYAIAADVEIR